MKILQMNNYHYERGGSDVIYLRTGALLSSAGHEVKFFSVGDPEALQTSEEVFFVDPPNFRASLFSRLLNVPRFL